ncbi:MULTISPECIES: autotransporter outer membrane beta-barrel domain-containing protein [unclassified Pseudomonas]|uniref:autotransporter outer membrane beta-barrel domain-containing protein n=1 Tax=unclassified Pseudomonas TaxID=196821 RepID=UPI000CD19AD3|nr:MULTISPECIES: autotransporter outer membrane beta-barrel domain-containing protein [unclassified Pseudomonas]POA30886.1 autotransporter outer membrane beta-barrel domain-containing protein [Pseudomonas sp. GW456-R21]POA67914.1 autotransporter outer membrane beta-barrel domain-containing protein [Pseudomonas sp. GW460-R15]
MSLTQLFSLNPVVVGLNMSSLALLSLIAPYASAQRLDGTSLTISAPGVTQDWQLYSNAVLTVDGVSTFDIRAIQSTLNVNSGTTQQISASLGSTVNLVNTTVNAADGQNGVVLVNSVATISDSTINSNRLGIRIARNTTTNTGSTATVTGSTITGGTGGAWVTGLSALNLSNSTLQGTDATSYGLRLTNGSVTASNGSRIIGGQYGVSFTLDTTVDQPGTLVLHKSSAESRTGSAILVDYAGKDSAPTQIDILNGSTLKGGNGIILDVTGKALVNMNVGNSALNGIVQVAGNSTANLNFKQGSLTGDVIAESGSTANVQLQQGSLLTGRLENVAALGIDHQSEWAMTGNSQVGDLHTEGTVRFGADHGTDYKQLDVTNLSGDGLFLMRTHFTTGETDLLNADYATGDHRLLISSSGVDPASGQRIIVVRIQDGDAQFKLANADSTVDLGTYSYGLTQDTTGKNWFLDPSKRTVSPSTRVVSALFGAPLTVLYGEDASLRTRMGEVRFNPGKSGGWSRAFGSKYNVNGDYDNSYRQMQQGFALGVDTALGDGPLLLGVMAGYSQSDLALNHGSSATVDSYFLGGYLTWLGELGYYVDSTLKLNRLENKADVAMSDGAKSKGDYGNTAVSASVEAGRKIELRNGYFIEPSTRWSTAYIQGKNYGLDNGMEVEGDGTYSLLGKVGVTVGRELQMKNGSTLQPYVRAALAHEFSKSNKYKVNETAFNHDISGSRVEVGAGVAVKLTERWSVNAEVEYMNGTNIEMPTRGTLGVQFKF